MQYSKVTEESSQTFQTQTPPKHLFNRAPMTQSQTQPFPNYEQLNQIFIYHFIASPFHVSQKILHLSPKIPIPNSLSTDIPLYSHLKCIKHVYRSHGFTSLWTGLIPFTTSGIFRYLTSYNFPIYPSKDFNQDSLVYNKKSLTKEILKVWLIRSLGTVVSTVIAYPLDIIGSRLCIDLCNNADERYYTGFFNCVRRIYSEEGLSGFFKGILVTIAGELICMTIFD